MPNGVAMLRKYLMYAIEHGAAACVDRNGSQLQVRAASILVLLFGKDELEIDGDTPAVPKEVTLSVISNLRSLVKGDARVMPNIIAESKALRTLSVSDANTGFMVEGGVLDLIAEVLTPAPEHIVKTPDILKHSVGVLREVCLQTLFNLALSEHTACAVASHVGIENGLEYLCTSDPEARLTVDATALLEKVKFQVNTTMYGARFSTEIHA
jgi:hypothetical protein